jgi:hypothetical protein
MGRRTAPRRLPAEDVLPQTHNANGSARQRLDGLRPKVYDKGSKARHALARRYLANPEYGMDV